MSRRTSAVAIALLWLVCRAASLDASFLDPALRFRTLTTPHFVIYFHQGEDRLASRLAAIAEDVWPKVGAALGTSAPRRTHVVLADQSEFANGWATPLPYNTIFVTAAAPSGVDFIGNTTDWLRLVFTHEFTHIVHLDRSEGWARVFRNIFGRSSIAFPNLWLPGWQIEGLAAWEESRLTGQGRLYDGDFRIIEREAARAGRVEPLDRVSGTLADWPSGLAPYAFGLGFHEYLAERFGEERFGELAQRTSRSIPFLGTLAFDDVFGQSLPELWRSYSKSLEATAAATIDTPAALPTQLTHRGFVIAGPRFAPSSCATCPSEIIYSAQDPHGFPSLESTTADGRTTRTLTSRYLGSTSSVTAASVVFDQQEFRRNAGLYSDLFVFDRHTGHTRALTHESRLQDADLSPDGRTLVAVREHQGARELVLVHLTEALIGSAATRARVARVQTLIMALDTQFDAPRWAPDGSTIVAERRRLGHLSEVVLVDPTTAAIRTLASLPDVRFVTPTWNPDGRSVIAAADVNQGVFNLYEIGVRMPSGTARMLTRTSGGATWPEVSPDGRTLIFVGYTVEGFDLFSTPYPADARSSLTVLQPEATTQEATPPSVSPENAAVYRPWRTLLPTSWAPLVNDTGDQIRVGAIVTGADVLNHHGFDASATWLVDAVDDAVRPSAGAPDWDVTYSYNRWQPAIFASTRSETIFTSGPADRNHRPTNATLRERELEAGVYLPVQHARRLHRAVGSVVRTSDDAIAPADATDHARTATRFGLSTKSSHLFGYSISQERGYDIGATAQIVRRGFGATDDATVLTLDTRAYLPGLTRHHVIALRAAGGVSSGNRMDGRVFVLGGGAPNGEVLDFSRGAFSLLRGFPDSSFGGSHVAVLNADYRWPIATPQRGLSASPIFLHTMHAAVFADAGHVWNAGFDHKDGKISAGGEFSTDLVVGYQFPFTVAVGAAYGHDYADSTDHASAYVRIGHAF